MAQQASVFLAYHHSPSEDAFAHRLVSDLRAVGVDVWYDNAGLLPGSFVEKFNHELEKLQWLVVLMTPGAIDSPWVRYEVDTALNLYQHGRMLGVIPFIIDPTARNAMPSFWRTLVSFDATVGYEVARDGLLHALRQGKKVPIVFPKESQEASASRNAAMKRIFISYRREDSADATGRIYDRLVLKYGREAVFKDVDDIPIGSDFREVLNDVINGCHIELVVIGQRWLTVTTPQGHRRIDSPSDFVRLEVETGLRRKIPVVPMLVQHTTMPSADELPDSLRDLAFRHGVPIRPDPDFHHDMDHLLDSIGRVFSEP